jgi:hypothetical protein
VPGDPAASAIIERITSDDPDVRMPPADSGKSLTLRQIDANRADPETHLIALSPGTLAGRCGAASRTSR